MPSALTRLALAGTLLAAALLTGCGPLPRPFASDGKDLASLRALAVQHQVLVLPLQADLASAPKARAAAVLAHALAEKAIPATTTGDPRRSRSLTGRAVVQRLNFREDEVLLYWELTEPDGRRIGSYAQRNILPHGIWQAGLAEGIDPAMIEAAGPIADLLRPPAVEQAPLPGFPDANVVLLPMDALPGDGPRSLYSALARELAAEGVPLDQTIDDDDLLVFGDVELGPDRGGTQSIKIIWYVIRAADSVELGQISQGNRVPTGALNGPWGPTANAIAKGAASGILQLLDQAGRAQS